MFRPPIVAIFREVFWKIATIGSPKTCSTLHYLYHNTFTYMYIHSLAASHVMTCCIFQQHRLSPSQQHIDYRFEHSVSQQLGPGRLLRVYFPVQILTERTENVGSCTNSLRTVCNWALWPSEMICRPLWIHEPWIAASRDYIVLAM